MEKIFCERKRLHIDPNRIREVPLSQRTSLQSLAHALNTNPTLLCRQQKLGIIQRHSNG